MLRQITRAAAVLTLLVGTAGGVDAAAAVTQPNSHANAIGTCDRARNYQHAFVPALGSRVDCLLSVGNTGEAVRTLQLTLRRCYGSTITADGIFGPATRNALRYAQRQAHTEDDGVYGPNTRRAIKHRPSSFPYGCQRVR
jgi:hypothetical protein